jgi:hypothetical protein
MPPAGRSGRACRALAILGCIRTRLRWHLLVSLHHFSQLGACSHPVRSHHCTAHLTLALWYLELEAIVRSIVRVPTWAYGKAWPWTPLSISRACHALPLYALRRPPLNCLIAVTGAVARRVGGLRLSSSLDTSRHTPVDPNSPLFAGVKTQGCQLVVPRQRFGATRSASSASSKRFDSVSRRVPRSGRPR